MIPTIAWSDFAKKHSRPGTGNSFALIRDADVIKLTQESWQARIPGAGEQNCDRKVVVPITSVVEHYYRNGKAFVCAPRMPLKVGMPIQAEVVTRQAGEDPYIQTFIKAEDAGKWGYEPVFADTINIVCYSADALMENGGSRSSDAEWEIVTILCSAGPQEPMLPLAMARNFLEMPGGSKGVYTAQEFAEAIYYHSNRGIRIKETSL